MRSQAHRTLSTKRPAIATILLIIIVVVLGSCHTIAGRRCRNGASVITAICCRRLGGGGSGPIVYLLSLITKIRHSRGRSRLLRNLVVVFVVISVNERRLASTGREARCWDDGHGARGQRCHVEGADCSEEGRGNVGHEHHALPGDIDVSAAGVGVGRLGCLIAAIECGGGLLLLVLALLRSCNGARGQRQSQCKVAC